MNIYRLFGSNRQYANLRDVIDAARAAGKGGYMKLVANEWQWRDCLHIPD